MVVEQLAAAAPDLHDPRAGLRIRRGPRDDPVLEQAVEMVLEPFGAFTQTPAAFKPADAV